MTIISKDKKVFKREAVIVKMGHTQPQSQQGYVHQLNTALTRCLNLSKVKRA